MNIRVAPKYYTYFDAQTLSLWITELQDNRPWIEVEGRPSKDKGGTSKVAREPSRVDSEAGLVAPLGIQSFVPSPKIII